MQGHRSRFKTTSMSKMSPPMSTRWSMPQTCNAGAPRWTFDQSKFVGLIIRGMQENPTMASQMYMQTAPMTIQVVVDVNHYRGPMIVGLTSCSPRRQLENPNLATPIDLNTVITPPRWRRRQEQGSLDKQLSTTQAGVEALQPPQMDSSRAIDQ